MRTGIPWTREAERWMDRGEKEKKKNGQWTRHKEEYEKTKGREMKESIIFPRGERKPPTLCP